MAWKLICEIQLLLHPYLEWKKRTHRMYEILREKELFERVCQKSAIRMERSARISKIHTELRNSSRESLLRKSSSRSTAALASPPTAETPYSMPSPTLRTLSNTTNGSLPSPHNTQVT